MIRRVSSSVSRPRARRCRGYTLIDLVIVVLVCLLFASLAFPMIGLFRERARRHGCSDNLRALGVALRSYHDTFRTLPPAAVWSGEKVEGEGQMKKERSIEVTHANWVQLLLPFLGQSKLAAQFDNAAPITAEANRVARTTELAVMKCPLDQRNDRANQCEYTAADGTAVKFARGNYAINAGVRWFFDIPGDIISPRAWGYTERVNFDAKEFQAWGDGIAGINKSFSLKDFRNGQSTMVALDEIRAGIAPMDRRGMWGVGQIGASITFNHGIFGDAVGPNSQRPHADDIEGCAELYKKFGREFVNDQEQMPCCDHCGRSVQAGARSRHEEGGAHLLMLDGAVRFASNNIDPTIWHLLHSSEAPATILAEEDLPKRMAGAPLNRESIAGAGAARNSQSASELPETLTNSLGMDFKRIPAGDFIMGLHDEGNGQAMDEEVPEHHVVISRPFLMGVHEVTQEQFQEMMHQNPSGFSVNGSYRERLESADTSRLPVENVTWEEAVEFCRVLSQRPEEKKAGRRYRLPTEAEWEYVCRAGSKVPRKHDRDPTNDRHLGEFGLKKPGSVSSVPTPVGSYPPNPFGIHDMRGNVWEWCQDYFARDYYKLSPEQDPAGPAEGVLRVWRGTDWVFTAKECKTSRLWALEPWVRSPCLGFRVVCIMDGSQAVNQQAHR